MKDLTVHRLSFVGFHSYLAYRDGKLFIIQLPEPKLMPCHWQAKFLEGIPQDEKNLPEFHTFFTAGKLIEISQRPLNEAKTQKDKIIAFSMAFKHYRGVSYSAKDVEKSNVKHVPVSKKLLDTFFQTPGLSNYTLENYIHRINITKDYTVNGLPDQRGPQLPDAWDLSFYKSCDEKTRAVYEKHLHELGYEKKYAGSIGTYFVRGGQHD